MGITKQTLVLTGKTNTFGTYLIIYLIYNGARFVLKQPLAQTNLMSELPLKSGH